MYTRAMEAREEAGFDCTAFVMSECTPLDITGWTLECKLTRQAGTTDITLGMAATADDDGFRIVDGASGEYSIRIAPETLAAVPDTTGSFTLYGSLFGVEPGGTKNLFEDFLLNVIKGPAA